MSEDWRQLIRQQLGPLPLGGILHRTDPNGDTKSPIVILGVYPAATQWKIFAHNGTKLKLPVCVEAKSFEPSSRSGADLDRTYLRNLEIERKDVLTIDLMPYFFANTARDKRTGRSMWDNVYDYMKITGEKTAVSPRPAEDELLRLCRTMEGNSDRIAEFVASPPVKLLVTLGREAAAYVHGHEHAEEGQQYLYKAPPDVDLFGKKMKVVSLVHPGLLQRNSGWKKEHLDWCRTSGRDLMKSVLS